MLGNSCTPELKPRSLFSHLSVFHLDFFAILHIDQGSLDSAIQKKEEQDKDFKDAAHTMEN